MRGIENNLDKFKEVGIRPVAISVDSPEVSRNLTQQAGYTFTFLSDPNAEVIRRYDLVHEGAGENGHDIARPAEFLVDSSGTVRWLNLTENYWVRARPEEILEVSKLLPEKTLASLVVVARPRISLRPSAYLCDLCVKRLI